MPDMTWLTYSYKSDTTHKNKYLYPNFFSRDHALILMIGLIAYLYIIWRWDTGAFIIALVVAAVLILLVRYLMSVNKIQLTKDYLLLEGRVIYLQCIDKIHLDKTGGSCTVECQKTRNFVIKEALFQSNANKDWKISANKKRMFNKFTEKLIKYCSTLNNPPIISIH